MRWSAGPRRDRHRRPDRAINPLRVLRHGRGAPFRLEAARPEDIAQMRRLLRSKRCTPALSVFTTSRTDSHKTPVGKMVPSRYAASDELVGIGAALGDVGAAGRIR